MKEIQKNIYKEIKLVEVNRTEVNTTAKETCSFLRGKKGGPVRNMPMWVQHPDLVILEKLLGHHSDGRFLRPHAHVSVLSG